MLISEQNLVARHQFKRQLCISKRLLNTARTGLGEVEGMQKMEIKGRKWFKRTVNSFFKKGHGLPNTNYEFLNL